MGAEASARLLQAFERQVGWCEKGGSPFSARVLACSHRWLAGQPAALVELAAVAEDPLAAAVSLRWLAGLHHLALLGREPWAGLWPPAGAPATDAALTSAIGLAWHEQRSHLLTALANAPQTNEVQRSAALLPGLLHVAAHTGLPLALNEIGSSAGLNLWCDHFHHDHGTWAWGDPSAPLTLRAEWRGPAPTLPGAPLRVVSRAGCDAQPVDLLQPGEDLRLASFIWADQAERLDRVRAAVAVACRHLSGGAVRVRAERAGAFVQQQLQQRVPGRAWVLMHSVVWQYIPADEQAHIRQQVQAAGAAATPNAPVAWLRFEPPEPDLRMELRCQIWPSGEDHLLAVCHPHGAWVEWQGGCHTGA